MTCSRVARRRAGFTDWRVGRHPLGRPGEGEWKATPSTATAGVPTTRGSVGSGETKGGGGAEWGDREGRKCNRGGGGKFPSRGSLEIATTWVSI
jgi:hypothetical protein